MKTLFYVSIDPLEALRGKERFFKQFIRIANNYLVREIFFFRRQIRPESVEHDADHQDTDQERLADDQRHGEQQDLKSGQDELRREAHLVNPRGGQIRPKSCSLISRTG